MTNAAQALETATYYPPNASKVSKKINNLCRRASQIREDSENRLAVYRGQFPFIEYYLNVKVCLGLQCVAGEFKQRGFVLQHLARRDEESGLLSYGHDEEAAWVCRQGQQPFVLTNNVQLMERPKQIITSLVRAEVFNDCEFSRGEPVFTFYPMQGIDKIMEAREERKMRITTGRSAIVLGNAGTQQIEGRSKRVDNGTDVSIDSAWKWAFFAKYRAFLSELRIDVYDLYSQIRASPGVELPGEKWELGFAPLDSADSVY